MAVTMKNGVIWNVAPCGSCKNRCFGGMSVLTRTTLHNIQEDAIPHVIQKLQFFMEEKFLV
jgi:hypothetical protein